MKNVAILAGASAIFAALSVPAFAQSEFSTGANATGVGAVDDRITDIEDDVSDAFDRSADADRFGAAERRQGLFGSMSLQYSGNSGNNEGQDLSLAGRVSYNQGQFAQSVGLAIEYGENEDGDKDKEDVSGIYDAQYYFNDRFYAFALGRFEINGLVDGDRDYDGQSDDDLRDEYTDYRRDGFLGFGPGYRVINTADTTWRVQAGVGIRYTQTGAQYAGENFDGSPVDESSNTDFGYIASSRLYHRFNDMVFLTNDTDFLGSDDSDNVISNELGLNFRMSEQLATRVSLSTEYQENRRTRTDNTVGVAVVYGF